MINKKELDYWDEIAINFCNDVINNLIKNLIKYSISPEKLKILADALIILNSYPKEITAGLITISSHCQNNNGSSYFQLDIAGDYLEIITGGSVYDPTVGSDSFSEVLFNSSSNSFNETEYFTIVHEEYKNSFISILNSKNGKLTIYDETYPIN